MLLVRIVPLYPYRIRVEGTYTLFSVSRLYWLHRLNQNSFSPDLLSMESLKPITINPGQAYQVAAPALNGLPVHRAKWSMRDHPGRGMMKYHCVLAGLVLAMNSAVVAAASPGEGDCIMQPASVPENVAGKGRGTASELEWREYDAGQRGSGFRSYWKHAAAPASRDALPGASIDNPGVTGTAGRHYRLRMPEENAADVRFGDGERGARPPASGSADVPAYRAGRKSVPGEALAGTGRQPCLPGPE